MPLKPEPYDIGDDVIIYADFEDATGTATTPSAGTLTVEDPAGAKTAYAFDTLANPSVGRLEKTISINQAGRWHFVFRATAPIAIAREGFVRVRTSRFGP